MIKLIIDLLQINPYYGVSERMDIAMGKNAIPRTWKGLWANIKRRLWLIRK